MSFRTMLYVAAVLAVLAPQTEGRLPVDGNLSARYQHVFDRNAIADSRRAGDSLVALTPGGLLMKLSLPGVELERGLEVRRVPDDVATAADLALGRGDPNRPALDQLHLAATALDEAVGKNAMDDAPFVRIDRLVVNA